MSFRQKVVSGLFWTGTARLLSQLVTWAMTMVVIRLLAPADYGLIAMATVFVGFVALLSEAGLGAALVQAPHVDSRGLRGIFAAVLVVDIALFAMHYLAAPLAAWFFDEDRLTLLVRVLGLHLLVSAFAVIPQAMLARALDFKRPSIIGLVANTCGSLVTLTLAFAGHGLWSIVVGNLVAQLVNTISLNVAAPFVVWPDFSLGGARGLIGFGGQFTASRLLWFFYSQADIFIAGKVLGKEALGFYSVALDLASSPTQRISAVLNTVAFPAFAHAQADSPAVRQHVQTAVRMLSLVVFPVLWGLSCVAPEIVSVILGDQWQPVVLPLQVLAVIMPVTILSPFLNAALQGLGKGGIVLKNVITASLLMPLAFVIGAQGGLLGLSLAWLIGFPLVFALNLSRMLPLLGVSITDLFGHMAPAVLASAVMYASVTSARALLAPHVTEAVLLIALVGVGAGTYAFVTVCVNRDALGVLRGLLVRSG